MVIAMTASIKGQGNGDGAFGGGQHRGAARVAGGNAGIHRLRDRLLFFPPGDPGLREPFSAIGSPSGPMRM